MKPSTEIRSVGFKDMHPDQAAALIKLIDAALNAVGDDDAAFDEMLSTAEDVVVLFGGIGIEVGYSIKA